MPYRSEAHLQAHGSRHLGHWRGVALKERENAHDAGEETSREIPRHAVTDLPVPQSPSATSCSLA